VSEALVAAILDALLPSLRRMVRDEVVRAEVEWRWRTAEQAGELLGVSGAAVRQRVRRGQLPGHRFDGRVYLDVRDLDNLIRDSRYDGTRLHVDQKWAERGCSRPGPGHRRV
jgi:hypothetical protein